MIEAYGYDILRHVFIKNIISYVKEFKPDRVYIAIDLGQSWRKQLSSIYKGQRKAARQKQDVDWDAFYGMMNKVTTELKENFPFYVLGIDTIEADDIIAHLVATEDSYVEKIMITCDRDYIQLLQHPNTKLYEPIRRKFIESINPLHDLEIKICSGDKSDNIPAIAHRWGEKTAEKHILNGKLDLMLAETEADGSPCEMKRNYDRNKALIDFELVPKSILRQIDEEVAKYELASHKGLLKYLMKHKLTELIESVGMLRKHLDPLT